MVFYTNNSINVHDLEKKYDIAFIDAVYNVILGRAADSQGKLHYLSMLRSGKLRKFDIIVRLRLSSEGRKYGIKIEDFGIKAVFSILRQIPVVGWLSFMFIDFLRLPFILNPIQAELADLRRLQCEKHYVTETAPLSDISYNDEQFLALDQRSLRIVNSLDNAVEIFSFLNKKMNDLELEFHNIAHRHSDLTEETLSKIDKLTRNSKIEFVSEIEKVSTRLQAESEKVSISVLKLTEYMNSNITSTKDLYSNEIAILNDQVLGLKSSVMNMTEDTLNIVHQEIAESQAGLIEKNAFEIAKINKHYAAVHAELQILQDNICLESNVSRLPIYAAFEDTFRDSESLIYENLRCYLPLVEKIRQSLGTVMALDLGSGRGEWLRLMTDVGIQAMGIDFNPQLVRRAKSYGLEVKESDILECIKIIPSDSVSIITAFHVAEHLHLGKLVAVLEQCRRILCRGGLLIVETLNPNMVTSAVYFSKDITRKTPLHPEILAFLLKTEQFCKIQTFNFQQDGIQRRLESIQGDVSLSMSSTELPQADYAIVAKKI